MSDGTHPQFLQEHATVATVELPARMRATSNVGLLHTKVQCGRCLNTMEIPSEKVKTHLRCTKCHRSLRLPRVLRQVCAQCGGHSDLGPDASGKPVTCSQCGMRINVPVQVAHSRRHRRKGGHRLRPEASLLPLVISLGVSILGLMLCFRLIANL